MESANEVVVEARLTGAGRGWGEAGLNPMLARRTAVCNDRWAEAWRTSQAEPGAGGRARRAAAAEVVPPEV